MELFWKSWAEIAIWNCGNELFVGYEVVGYRTFMDPPPP